METLTREGWAAAMTARRPLATDDFSRGLYRTDKPTALTRRHVQMNGTALLGALVFDVDVEDAARHVQSLAWDDEAIPAPSWITSNPHTDHAHVGYLLAEPVTTTNAAHRRPVEYAADLERTLRSRMGADYRYSGVVTRNPLHTGHVTTWGRSKPYTLGELQEPLGKLDPRPPRIVQEAGLGRNVGLFDTVRAWAYSNFRHFDSLDRFSRAVTAHALALNAVSFDAPLSITEARCVARSVASWTWRTFTENQRHNTYSEMQRNRAMRRAAYLSRQDAVALIRGKVLEGHRMSAAEVMEKFDVSRRTAFNYLEEAGLTEQPDLSDRTVTVAELRAQGKSYGQIMEETGLSKSQVRYALRKAAEAA